jgi:RNA polymerase sigma factor (sigma-70 family)
MGRQKPSRVALVESVRRLTEEQTVRLLPFIEAVARKSGLPDPPFAIEDLIQEGVMAAFEALPRYDPRVTNQAGEPVKLETFLYPRVWGAIRDYARATGYLLSGGQRSTATRKARREHIVSLSRDLPEPRDWQGGPATWADILPDAKAPVATQRLDARSAWQCVCRGMNRNQRILTLEYFVHGRTLREIGKTLDLSESRCSQMLTEILARLRRLDEATQGGVRAMLAA